MTDTDVIETVDLLIVTRKGREVPSRCFLFPGRVVPHGTLVPPHVSVLSHSVVLRLPLRRGHKGPETRSGTLRTDMKDSDSRYSIGV